MVASLPTAYAMVTRLDIVAIIKDSQYMEMITPSSKTMTEHLCGDLWIVYAIDRPETTSTLSYLDMTTAGVSEGELRSLATENLRRILPEVERHGDGPWYLLKAGADYVASLLLFGEMWDQLAGTIDGRIVATVPTRDVLLYTGSESEDGLSAIRERSARISSSAPHAISDSLIVREDGRWTVFKAN
jgi:uncharacterized protein YtpQ (UPF0354 family)